MDFYAILDRVIDLLKQRERVTYRALKRQFDLDDAALADLKEELLFSHPVVEEDNRGFVWSGAPVTPETERGWRGVSEGQFQTSLLAVVTLLQRDQRVTYRTLKYAFGIKGELLTEIREELSFRRLAIDEGGKGLVWVAATISPASPVPEPHMGDIDAITNGPSVTPVTLDDAPEAPSSDQQITSPETAHRAAEAERRQLTVMFCDLVGSTDLSGRLDPEDLREVVRAYQETAAEVIERYEGHIAQYLGDGLLIYFGYPVAHEDDAQRAVHTGLGIVEAMGALNLRLHADCGVELAVRIGIHTGPVVIGELGGGGRHENLALGETPNIAARLQALAQPNTTVLSLDTAQLTQHFFVLQELDPQPLKGVSKPIRLFAAIGPREVAPDQGAMTTVRFEALVGRDEEIGLLRRRWEQSKDGLGQVVLLSGEGGIGKSSLVEGLRHDIGRAGYTQIVFRCSPYHSNSMLYPVVERLQRVIRWRSDDPFETKLARLEQQARTSTAPVETAVSLIAALLAMPLPEERYPALSLSPQQQRQQTLDLLVTLMQEEAERQPVLALWEDLHWADPTSLELLGLLIDQAPMSPMLHILTFRPDFTPPWPMRSHVTPIALNRLERPQIEAMLTRLTHGKALPEEVRQHIVTQTDGVPLYVEELTKMLLDSDLLREADDHYELTGELSRITIPETLQDSLMARLDRLPMAREIAQYGAVLGREFAYGVLEAIVSFEAETLQQGLEQLTAAELLYQRGRPPRARYLFKHALIQDAAYGSLLKSTRQHLHQQVAQFLETQMPETVEAQPELVAHHYTEAGLAEPAMTYWRQAGSHAMSRSAHREAVVNYERALAAVETLPETHTTLEQGIDLRLELRNALLPLGEQDLEREHMERAEALAEALGDPHRQGRILGNLGTYFMLKGDFDRSVASIRRMLDLAITHDNFGLRVQSNGALALVYREMGDYDQAALFARQNVALLEGNLVYEHFGRLALPSVSSCFCLAACLAELGDFTEGQTIGKEAVRIAETIDHPYNRVVALTYGIGLVSYYKGDFTTAIHALEPSLALCQNENINLHLPFTASLLASTYARVGRLTEVQGLLEQIEIDKTVYGPTLVRINLSEVKRHTGQLEASYTLIQEALMLSRSRKERGNQAWCLRLMGELTTLNDSSKSEQAADCYQQALTLAEELGMRPLQAHCHRGLGHLYSQTDQTEQARAELSIAIEMYRDMEMTFWLPETETALAKVEA